MPTDTTDDNAVLEYLKTMHDRGFTAWPLSQLRDDARCPIPGERFNAAVKRLTARGEMTIRKLGDPESIEKSKQRHATDEENIAWLDSLSETGARAIAEINKARPWAQAWLAKHGTAEVVEKAAEIERLLPTEKLEPVLKAALREHDATFVKAEAEKLEALDEFEKGLAVFAELIGKTPQMATADYARTPVGAERYAKVCKADAQLSSLMDGNQTLIAARAQRDEVLARIAARIEQASLAWNWMPVETEKRLDAISSDQKADKQLAGRLDRQVSDLTFQVAARRDLIATARGMAMPYTPDGRSDGTEAGTLPPQKRAQGPALKRFSEELGAFAKAKKTTEAAATADFTRTDVGAALYQAVVAEDMTRQGLVR